ncbi:amino acid ABC transporter permease [Tardiphaga alba]|uniref:Amino acid ABC transporter permease n=1 Tax=Tardiphaga alba TaxID=340268 RepID=A0ABX8A8E6_9BRAD|nr:amino acid ABC transporter permease [Tardiphaga alba]QUS39942.1 amino acid ABC transporter permease [Tardiphaga alba]
MSETAYVAGAMITARDAPVRSTGLVGFVRGRLLNSPTNILLTAASILLLWFTIVPLTKFLLVDAVWHGSDRSACLPETLGRPVGACWPFVQAKFSQFIYGFYPESERWRVDLTFLIGALVLLPLLIPRLPGKTTNAAVFFLAFPVVAFFLLYGGGLDGFGIGAAIEALAIGADHLKAWGIPLASDAHVYLALLHDWLRNQGDALGSPVWFEFGIVATFVSLVILAAGGIRAFVGTVATFAATAVMIAALRLDHGGLPIVPTGSWGGLLVTLVVATTGIVASMPVGIALALGRRSGIPLIRIASVAFIEFWRGVPLITVLFFATYMLPLFLPGNFTIDGLLRVLIGVALFAGAYNAEVIRGGLAAIPRGQAEAASALGLSWWRTTRLIVLPQALRHVIPGLVNSFIALLKDTSLVSIVALFDLLGQLRAAFADPEWSSPTTLFTGFAFTGIIYFVLCFGMSRYSLFVEHRLNAHRRS